MHYGETSTYKDAVCKTGGLSTLFANRSSMAKGHPTSTVILNYIDLVNGSVLSEDIATAFGGDGQGILFVRGVPGYADARLKLLPLASKFSKLDRAVQVFNFSSRPFEGAHDVCCSLRYGRSTHHRKSMCIMTVATRLGGRMEKKNFKVALMYPRDHTMLILSMIGRIILAPISLSS